MRYAAKTQEEDGVQTFENDWKLWQRKPSAPRADLRAATQIIRRIQPGIANVVSEPHSLPAAGRFAGISQIIIGFSIKTERGYQSEPKDTNTHVHLQNMKMIGAFGFSSLPDSTISIMPGS
jgi:hypothetical protein